MGPVEDSKEAYSLDCYFRQSWTDKRLRSVSHIMSWWHNISTSILKFTSSFKPTGGMTTLALNWAFLAKIWVGWLLTTTTDKDIIIKTIVNCHHPLCSLTALSYSVVIKVVIIPKLVAGSWHLLCEREAIFLAQDHRAKQVNHYLCSSRYISTCCTI